MGIDIIIDKINKVEELTEGERKTVSIALKWLAAAMYEKIPDTPFICGHGGKAREGDNMPEYFHICPTYGVDWSVTYKRVDIDEPGY